MLKRLFLSIVKMPMYLACIVGLYVVLVAACVVVVIVATILAIVSPIVDFVYYVAVGNKNDE